jgi:two-component system chemotaxis response regulator CheB
MPQLKFVVVIGASAGGAAILSQVLNQFTSSMPIAVFIAMHVSKASIGEMLVRRLQKYTSFKCKIPATNELIKSEHVYFARPDHHLMLKKNKIILGKGPHENRYRPSIDALFRSAAAEYGNKAIGIILSGMLEDGASGMLSIKRAGGSCIVQDPEEAQFPDMPKAVLKYLKPDYKIATSEVGAAISAIISRPKKKSGKNKIPKDIIKEAQIAEQVNIRIDELKELGKQSLYSCPDCGGGLWEIESSGSTRYRCHTGHAYSENGLLSSMEVTTEAALWTALRILEERRNLLKTLSEKKRKNGSPTVADGYRKRIKELELQIKNLRTVLFST